VPQVMAQFVLKIELLSHIMGTTPILEMARAYGLRPRLWLLLSGNIFVTAYLSNKVCMYESISVCIVSTIYIAGKIVICLDL